MTDADLARLLTQALQAGAEQMAKAAGVPLAQYQQIVLGAKWRQTLRAKRAELVNSKQKGKKNVQSQSQS